MLALQRGAGNQAVSRMLSGAPVVARQTTTESDIHKLDEMLDAFNTPEDEVIALIGAMSPGDKAIVATPAYRDRIAAALNFDEMMQVVRVLPLTLPDKLAWLKAAATIVSAIDYGEIRSLVTAAPQGERDALKTGAWQGFFVDVCDNATMVTALNDLGFDLQTKLTWLRAEMTVTSWELDYPTIQPWITAAPQGERDALKTTGWRGFFVDVCTNATMITALNDLRFDLVTKLQWLDAELTITRAELEYGTIQPWIVAAPQGERDALKTTGWRDFFVKVCTNATMETAVTDLGFPLPDKLRWMIAEGCGYDAFKRVITAAADKAVALADQALLLELKDELSWNDFARCVELLGRLIPGGGALIGDGTVQAALASAFTASNPAIVPAPPAPAPQASTRRAGSSTSTSSRTRSPRTGCPLAPRRAFRSTTRTRPRTRSPWAAITRIRTSDRPGARPSPRLRTSPGRRVTASRCCSVARSRRWRTRRTRSPARPGCISRAIAASQGPPAGWRRRARSTASTTSSRLAP